MTLNISVNSSLPTITNVVMGNLGEKNYYLDLITTSNEDVRIVNDFIGVVGTHINVGILYYPEDIILESTIIISEVADLEIITINYLTLNENDTIVVDNFIDLLKRLTNV